MSSNSIHLVQRKAFGLGPETNKAAPSPAVWDPLFPCVSTGLQVQKPGLFIQDAGRDQHMTLVN